MKPVKITLVFITAILFFSSMSINAQDVMKTVEKIAAQKLTKYASAKEIVSAVNSQNAKAVPLAKIKELDAKWSSTSGLDDFMKSLLDNNCSKYLKSLRKDNVFIVEAFAMDNQGANVGLTNKTSDYWQGDEDKFIKSYNGGAGKIHYGKLTFDESSQAYVIQVSVPVTDKGKTIGAVTFGIDATGLK